MSFSPPPPFDPLRLQIRAVTGPAVHRGGVGRAPFNTSAPLVSGGGWGRAPHPPPTPPLTQRGTSCHIQHSPNTPTTGLRERRNDTSKSTGRSSRQNAATRRNMRRAEWVTVQGPVKKQQPDGMSHRGGSRVEALSQTSPHSFKR